VVQTTRSLPYPPQWPRSVARDCSIRQILLFLIHPGAPSFIPMLLSMKEVASTLFKISPFAGRNILRPRRVSVISSTGSVMKGNELFLLLRDLRMQVDYPLLISDPFLSNFPTDVPPCVPPLSALSVTAGPVPNKFAQQREQPHTRGSNDVFFPPTKHPTIPKDVPLFLSAAGILLFAQLCPRRGEAANSLRTAQQAAQNKQFRFPPLTKEKVFQHHSKESPNSPFCRASLPSPPAPSPHPEHSQESRSFGLLFFPFLLFFSLFFFCTTAARCDEHML